MVIREVVEATYKADKTIILSLLRMYFHDLFLCMCVNEQFSLANLEK